MTDKDRMEVLALMEARSIPEPNSGCWIWLAATDRDGYGRTKWRGNSMIATRLCYEASHKEAPGPLSVMHSCNVSCCVNPNHLSLGTTLKNLRDAAAQGRMGRGRKTWSVARGGRSMHLRTPVGDTFELTAVSLRTLLHYDPETGFFTWLPRQDDIGWTRKNAGKRAGWIMSSSGYRSIRIFGRDYLAHRLVWLYEHGRWPYEGREIDHRFDVRDDNRLSELREVTHGQNGQNTGLRVNNRSGVKGVSWDGRRNKWVAMITVGSKQRGLGRYVSFDDAVAARRAAETADHGEFARTEGTA